MRMCVPVAGGPVVGVRLVSRGKLLYDGSCTAVPLTENESMVLVVDERRASFSFLSGIRFGEKRVRVSYCGAERLPETWLGYDGVDLVVLGQAAVRDFAPEQKVALEQWVRAGGTLVLSTGSAWHRYRDSFAEELAGVKLVRSGVLSSLDGLADRYGEPVALRAKVLVCEARALRGKVLAREGEVPLLIAGSAGLGKTFFLSFDAGTRDLRLWKGSERLWQEMFLSAGPDSGSWPLSAESAQTWLTSVSGMKLPPVSLVSIFLGVYLVVLVPVNYLVFRARRRLEYAWVAGAVAAIMFAVGAFRIGNLYRGSEVILSELSLIRMDAGSPSARIDTWWTLFSPRLADYDLELDAGMLVRQASMEPGAVTVLPTLRLFEDDKVRMPDLRVNMWAARAFRSRSYSELGGGVDSSVAMKGSMLAGTLVNNTSFSLEYCLLAMGRQLIPVGRIAAGESSVVKAEMAGDLWRWEGGGSMDAHVGGREETPTESGRMMRDARVELLHSLGDLAGGRGPGSATLLGFVDEPVHGLDLLGMKVDRRSLALVVMDLPLRLARGEITVPRTAWRRTMDANGGLHFHGGGEGGSLDGHGDGECIFEFSAPVRLEGVDVESLRVYFASSLDDGDVGLSAYDWQAGAWDEFGDAAVIELRPLEHLSADRDAIRLKMTVGKDGGGDRGRWEVTVLETELKGMVHDPD